MPDQTLLLEFGKRHQRLFKRLVLWRAHAANAEIHHVHRIEPKIAQVVMHGIDNLLPGARVRP